MKAVQLAVLDTYFPDSTSPAADTTQNLNTPTADANSNSTNSSTTDSQSNTSLDNKPAQDIKGKGRAKDL